MLSQSVQILNIALGAFTVKTESNY